MVVSAPVRDARDPLAYAVEHSGAVVTGGLLVLVMGLSLAFVPVVLFPVLRRIDEVLAVGYLIVRGAVETACYVVLAIGWLLLVPLGEAMAAGAGTASPAGVRVGNLVIDADATNAVLAARVLPWCAVMFYVLLYRSRIVPRWISAWGLVAIPFYVAADLLAMYGVFDVNAPGAGSDVHAAGRAGDGAGGLDDRARLPSGGCPASSALVRAHAVEGGATRRCSGRSP